MAASEAIIGEEWKERSRELANWAMDHLVNRRDVWGQHALLSPEQARESGRAYKAMTMPVPEMRGEDRVTLDKLLRHFASRWLGIDIDNHDLETVGADGRGCGGFCYDHALASPPRCAERSPSTRCSWASRLSPLRRSASRRFPFLLLSL